MSKGTTLKSALATWAARENIDAAEAEKVELFGWYPPIEKMDTGLGDFVRCRHLSLSTNKIEKINCPQGMLHLQILSLGRNLIKKLDGLDNVALTLIELWISYNSIEKLSGVEKLAKLRTLYISNNKIKDWTEIDRLAQLPELEELILLGNPICPDTKDKVEEYRIKVLQRLPKLRRLDGSNVRNEEKEKASLLMSGISFNLNHSSTSPASGKTVAVLGAAGGIGQPLSMLLKMNTKISDLRLYDVIRAEGIAADISHMNTPCKVNGFSGNSNLPSALYGCDLVIIPAGVPRKPGMSRDDLFEINAGIVYDLVKAIAKYCPKALVAIISNPVNSTVPIAAETLRRAGVYNPNKLFGVTKLDVVRANTFYAEMINSEFSENVNVPVIGGHAGLTILPLLSQASPAAKLSAEQITQLTYKIQNAGTEIVKAKAGSGSATLSMAYAAASFVDSCLSGLLGESVYEYAYVESGSTHYPYFASRVKLGENGIVDRLPLGHLSEFEKEGLDKLERELMDSIRKGLDFVNKQSQK